MAYMKKRGNEENQTENTEKHTVNGKSNPLANWKKQKENKMDLRTNKELL